MIENEPLRLRFRSTMRCSRRTEVGETIAPATVNDVVAGCCCLKAQGGMSCRNENVTRHTRPLGIYLLSCLATMAAASSDADDGSSKEKVFTATTAAGMFLLSHLAATKMCAAERALEKLKVLNFDPVLFLPSSTSLGDGKRSIDSSGSFFDYMDKDGDGAIEPEEIAMFLLNKIGGEEFDTQSEVDDEVGTIMARLDHNHNNELEMSDMLIYWNQLENLLTAEEVAEWIVYSVQLPSSIGSLFLENGITGYDFLEIVENKGQVLIDELGITKESFRNKIVRRMQSRMLGIGSSPETPPNFTYKLESCNAVTLSWERSTARVFPIHSYRIQRRGIHLIGSAGSSVESSSMSISVGFDLSFTNSNTDWKAVYIGGDTEYVDTVLETGHNYMYRIQAWNSVGKSGWGTVDLAPALKRRRCSTKPSPQKFAPPNTVRGIPAHADIHYQSEWTSTPKRVAWGVVALIQFVYHTGRFFFMLIAILAGVMRFRRATATSSTSAQLVLPIPWLWKGMNRISIKMFGQEFIPRSMLGDQEALKRQEQLHDEKIMATGLRGYDRVRAGSTVNDDNENNGSLADKRIAFRRKSLSTGDLRSTLSPPKPKEVLLRSEGMSPSKFAWLSPLGKSRPNNLASISEVSLASASLDESESAVAMARSVVSKSSTNLESLDNSNLDNGRVCSECMKKFQIGKRYKHHCAQCMATFCHKHGRTNHSNFTSCKIPGDCICNSCLALPSN